MRLCFRILEIKPSESWVEYPGCVKSWAKVKFTSDRSLGFSTQGFIWLSADFFGRLCQQMQFPSWALAVLPSLFMGLLWLFSDRQACEICVCTEAGDTYGIIFTSISHLSPDCMWLAGPCVCGRGGFAFWWAASQQEAPFFLETYNSKEL